MATQTQIQQQLPPDYVQERQKDLLLTLFGQGAPGDSDYVQGLINQPRNIPMQQVAGFTQPQQDAFTLAGQGIGAFQPYITQAGQTAGTAGQALAGATQQFVPTTQNIDQFRDPYQQFVTQQALQEIDRQGAMAQNQLAGQAVKGGVFGGSRYGVQEAELQRNLGDIKSRRIFEDASRNYQQALAGAQAAQEAQQRRQLSAERS